jgi:hypothetical protein
MHVWKGITSPNETRRVAIDPRQTTPGVDFIVRVLDNPGQCFRPTYCCAISLLPLTGRSPGRERRLIRSNGLVSPTMSPRRHIQPYETCLISTRTTPCIFPGTSSIDIDPF